MRSGLNLWNVSYVQSTLLIYLSSQQQEGKCYYPILQIRNGGSERLGHLPKVTQLMDGSQDSSQFSLLPSVASSSSMVCSCPFEGYTAPQMAY